ncbi:hypothetical protein GCK72_003929 [Caenorhabditis remanei]|uniref:DUF7809 domain-containing protein n=1 Tax=Caenorhabditis remanei TaxID=31234 RepID=A0A6A5HC59_CAERE|nr:hypothetical protein GCK72_003929 [Caenorhabditis remanei]KAF1763983.1 hypothetical protein GCK72_003929 [Caenorhabditis remanei]
MSSFLEFPDIALTPMCLHKEAMVYMIEELGLGLVSFNRYPEGSSKRKEEELMKLLIESGGYRLRMYGSAHELWENLKIFRNFSQSHQFFHTVDEPYQTTPIIYRNSKNEEFICKSDLFAILQNITLRIQKKLPFEVISIVAYFLKTQEERLNGKMEFVRFNTKIFEEIEKELRQEIEKNTVTDEYKRLALEMPLIGVERSFEKMKSLNPAIWNEMREKRIRGLVAPLLEAIQLETRGMALAAIHISSDAIIRSLRTVIDKRPELFQRSDLKEKKTNVPMRVRLFEDGNQKFVMKDDVEETDGNSKEKDLLFTMSMDELIEKYGEENVEFLPYPIRRAKHRAVPIKGVGFFKDHDEFYVLAVDAFFELLGNLIFGQKLFQNVEFKDFLEFFAGFESQFKPNLDKPYFMRLKMIGVMKEMMGKVMTKKVEKKEIRNAKSDGFSLQNLKNELKYLGLNETFPEIEEHAEVVFKHVDSVKKERFLRTCDLFDAIKHCQLICVLQRLPNYKKFLHNQKGCGRIPGLKCNQCVEIPKLLKNLKLAECVEDIQKTSSDFIPESVSQLELELEKKMEENRKFHETILKLNAENEANKRVIQQLIDKLSGN